MNGLLATLLVLLTVNLTFAQPSYYEDRYRKPQTITALQGPYTWADSINCSAGAYTVPDSIIVCEMRTTDSCLVAVDLRGKANIQIRAAANDIFRLDVRKVYKTGTDSLSRYGNKIRLFGIVIKQ